MSPIASSPGAACTRATPSTPAHTATAAIGPHAVPLPPTPAPASARAMPPRPLRSSRQQATSHDERFTPHLGAGAPRGVAPPAAALAAPGGSPTAPRTPLPVRSRLPRMPLLVRSRLVSGPLPGGPASSTSLLTKPLAALCMLAPPAPLAALSKLSPPSLEGRPSGAGAGAGAGADTGAGAGAGAAAAAVARPSASAARASGSDASAISSRTATRCVVDRTAALACFRKPKGPPPPLPLPPLRWRMANASGTRPMLRGGLVAPSEVGSKHPSTTPSAVRAFSSTITIPGPDRAAHLGRCLQASPWGRRCRPR
jgi:hypothetical protein